jgi:hypothetical protein
MRYILPILFGAATGLVVGFLFIYMLPHMFSSAVGNSIAGGIVGMVFGALIGSISGELNASGDAGGHRLLVAGFFGFLGGAMGATKLLLVWMIFQRFKWPIPDWAPPLTSLTSLF